MMKRFALLLAALLVASMVLVAPVFASGRLLVSVSAGA
jgi:hypothetical protein